MAAQTDESLNATLEQLTAKDRWEDALELVESHRAEVLMSFDLSWNAGWINYKLREFAGALPFLRRAVELAPANPTGHWALGVVLRELGSDDDAERAFIESIRVRDSYRARLSLALLLVDHGRLKEAERVHRDGVQRQPKYRERVEGLANFLYDIGRKEEAETLYNEAGRLPTRQERRRRSEPG